jgi:restriction system protein
LRFAADSSPVVGVATNTTPGAGAQLHTLFHVLLPLWPLALLVALAGTAKVALEMAGMRRLRRTGIFDIDRMSGPMFEQRLAGLFQALGYRTQVIGSSRGDFGGDLLISREGRRTVVQAKRWNKKSVGVKAVQEAVGARGYYNADSALVVTNSRFTNQARELARKNDVKLWDRDRLVETLLQIESKQETTPATSPRLTVVDVVPTPASALAVASGAAAVAIGSGFCARCGDAVSEKVRDYCLAHPEWFDGLVYCFDDQRPFKRSRRRV